MSGELTVREHAFKAKQQTNRSLGPIIAAYRVLAINPPVVKQREKAAAEMPIPRTFARLRRLKLLRFAFNCIGTGLV